LYELIIYTVSREGFAYSLVRLGANKGDEFNLSSKTLKRKTVHHYYKDKEALKISFALVL